AEVERLLSASKDQPFADDLRLPGEGTELTYAAAYRVDTVREARDYLADCRNRLLRVRNVGAALGLLRDCPGHAPVLVISPNTTLQQANARLRTLLREYPDARSEMVLAELPEAMRAQVNQEADYSLRNLLESGRKEVTRQYRRASGDK